MASIKSINNICYGIESNRVRKLGELPVIIPLSWVYMDPNPTRYGSFVVNIKNLDTNEKYKCYMPKYIAGGGCTGKLFVYEGLEMKTDGSRHSFHKVVFLFFIIFFRASATSSPLFVLNGSSHLYFENTSITTSRYFTPLFSLARLDISTKSGAHISSMPGEYTRLLRNLRFIGL